MIKTEIPEREGEDRVSWRLLVNVTTRFSCWWYDYCCFSSRVYGAIKW